MRHALFLLIAALMITCASCAQRVEYPADDAYHIETDFPYMLHGAGFITRNIAETESGYYLMHRSFLYYTEKQTLQTAVVCSRPNCRHADETESVKRESCHAYIPLNPVTDAPLFYASGKLYTVVSVRKPDMGVDQFVLTELSTDATRRREITVIATYDTAVSPYSMAVHRGYFYWVTQQFDEDTQLHGGIFRIPLHGKPDVECLYRTESADAFRGIFNLYPVGNHLFFLQDDPENPGYLQSFQLDLRDFTVRRLFDTDRLETVLTPVPYRSKLYNLLTFSDEVILNRGALSIPSHSYRCDPGGDNLEVWGDVGSGYMTTDEKYLYHIDIPIFDTPPLAKKMLRVYDEAGTLVDSFPVGREFPGYQSFFATQEHLIVYCQERTLAGNEGIFVAIDKDAIGTGEWSAAVFLRG